ncbi:MAG TPA: PACE efflux transporter [Corynebacterium sp.]|nr:PACE efflux transporter [Corynebacterium sp.]
MSPLKRRLLYVLSYEIIAVVFVSVSLTLLGLGGGNSTLIAVVSSAVAVGWNFLWNTLFECWEKKQHSQTRTLGRRVVHSLGFEGGLVVFLVPVIALILGVGLVEAFFLELGLLVFFLLYTFVFAWVFDRILPPHATVIAQQDPHYPSPTTA